MSESKSNTRNSIQPLVGYRRIKKGFGTPVALGVQMDLGSGRIGNYGLFPANETALGSHLI